MAKGTTTKSIAKKASPKKVAKKVTPKKATPKKASPKKVAKKATQPEPKKATVKRGKKIPAKGYHREDRFSTVEKGMGPRGQNDLRIDRNHEYRIYRIKQSMSNRFPGVTFQKVNYGDKWVKLLAKKDGKSLGYVTTARTIPCLK